jgi:hypothetical protein
MLTYYFPNAAEKFQAKLSNMFGVSIWAIQQRTFREFLLDAETNPSAPAHRFFKQFNQPKCGGMGVWRTQTQWEQNYYQTREEGFNPHHPGRLDRSRAPKLTNNPDMQTRTDLSRTAVLTVSGTAGDSTTLVRTTPLLLRSEAKCWVRATFSSPTYVYQWLS